MSQSSELTPRGTRPASYSYATGAADINKPCYTSCTSPEPLASRSGSVFALDSAADQAQHPAYYSSRSGRIRSARWPPAMWVSRLGEARLPTCFIAGTRPGAPRRLLQGAFIENCILYSPVVPEVAFSLSERQATSPIRRRSCVSRGLRGRAWRGIVTYGCFRVARGRAVTKEGALTSAFQDVFPYPLV